MKNGILILFFIPLVSFAAPERECEPTLTPRSAFASHLFWTVKWISAATLALSLLEIGQDLPAAIEGWYEWPDFQKQIESDSKKAQVDFNEWRESRRNEIRARFSKLEQQINGMTGVHQIVERQELEAQQQELLAAYPWLKAP